MARVTFCFSYLRRTAPPTVLLSQRDGELSVVNSPDTSSSRQGQSARLCAQELPKADVPMSISASQYAVGGHLTVRSITAYRMALARMRTRAQFRQSEQSL